MDNDFKMDNLTPVIISKWIDSVNKTVIARAGRTFLKEGNSKAILAQRDFAGTVSLFPEEMKRLNDPRKLTEEFFLGPGIIIENVDLKESSDGLCPRKLSFYFRLNYSQAKEWDVLLAIGNSLFEDSRVNIFAPIPYEGSEV